MANSAVNAAASVPSKPTITHVLFDMDGLLLGNSHFYISLFTSLVIAAFDLFDLMLCFSYLGWFSCLIWWHCNMRNHGSLHLSSCFVKNNAYIFMKFICYLFACNLQVTEYLMMNFGVNCCLKLGGNWWELGIHSMLSAPLRGWELGIHTYWLKEQIAVFIFDLLIIRIPDGRLVECRKYSSGEITVLRIFEMNCESVYRVGGTS